jgi:hypothetical protein
VKFALPLDVERDIEKILKAKFGSDFEDTKFVINTVFSNVLKKSLIDGSCLVRNFGSFRAYTHDSNKTGRREFKLKFVMSINLDEKVKNDKLLFDNIPYRKGKTFTDRDRLRVKTPERIEIFKENVENTKNIVRASKMKTIENLTKQAIDDIIENNNNDNNDLKYFKESPNFSNFIKNKKDLE